MIQVVKMSRQYVWFLLAKQFWLRVRYGLCAVSASYNKLLESLMKVYCQIHPQGGIQHLVRMLEHLRTGMYITYPYHEYHDYRVLVLGLARHTQILHYYYLSTQEYTVGFSRYPR
jgi:hypothetical protein